jgi:hypothetical protein
VSSKLFTFQASSPKPLGQLEPDLAGMFLGWSSTKLLFFVPVGCSHGPLVGPGELKTKVLLPQVTIADFGYPVWSLWFKRKNIWLFNPFALSAPDGVIDKMVGI